MDVLLEKVEQEGKTKGWTEGRYGENMLLELFHSLLKRESTVYWEKAAGDSTTHTGQVLATFTTTTTRTIQLL